MSDVAINQLAPWAATLISLVVAYLTHRRAVKAQKDQFTLDRSQVIQDAYQSVLDELRSEIDRLKQDNIDQRIRWEERDKDRVRRIQHLESELARSHERCSKLEYQLRRVSEEIISVERDQHDE